MIRTSVETDKLIELFCDVNNLFINVRGGFFNTEEAKHKAVHTRQLEIKRKLAEIINGSYGFKQMLNGEYHPFELKPEEVKKILEKMKMIM